MPPNSETPRRRLTGAVIPAVAAAAVAAAAALAMVAINNREQQQVAAGPLENCILEGAEEVGGPIALIDTAGRAVTQADFAGEPVVLYFGFTHCPDICPTTMYTLAEAQALPDAYDVRTALISVDPERDTPESMASYVSTNGFPAGLMGLTGSVEQVDAAKQAFRVYSARVPRAGAIDGYTVDHTSLAYVMDGEWHARAIIRTTGATPAQMAQCISAGLAAAESG
jgi:protein SCO1